MNQKNTAPKKYGLTAIDDNESVCCVCGKTELKKVMWIVELDQDGNAISEAFHTGTTCGAKLTGQKQSTINKVISNYETIVNKIKRQIASQKEIEFGYNEIINNWNKQKLNFRQRRETPEYKKLIEIKEKARQYAEQQKTIVEIK